MLKKTLDLSTKDACLKYGYEPKMRCTLENIRKYYPASEQFGVVYKFLMDQTQVMNAKLKVSSNNLIKLRANKYRITIFFKF